MSLLDQIQAEKSRVLDERHRVVTQLDKLRLKLTETDVYLDKLKATEEVVGQLVDTGAMAANGASEPKRRSRRSVVQDGLDKPKRAPVLKDGSFGAETLRVVRSFGELGATQDMIYKTLHAAGIDALPIHVGKSLRGHLNNDRLIVIKDRWFDPEFADGPKSSESEAECHPAERQDELYGGYVGQATAE